MLQGRSDEAWRTVHDCQRLFPSPEMIEALTKVERAMGSPEIPEGQ
jgi:hypothetical protein